jgi:hypothetical protein
MEDQRTSTVAVEIEPLLQTLDAETDWRIRAKRVGEIAGLYHRILSAKGILGPGWPNYMGRSISSKRILAIPR